jgi:hypothetical protein
MKDFFIKKTLKEEGGYSDQEILRLFKGEEEEVNVGDDTSPFPGDREEEIAANPSSGVEREKRDRSGAAIKKPQSKKQPSPPSQMAKSSEASSNEAGESGDEEVDIDSLISEVKGVLNKK